MQLIWSFLFCRPIHWWWKSFEPSILNDHNDTFCTKWYLRKCQITNPLSNQTSWNANHTTPYQFQNSLSETTYRRGNASPKAYRFWHLETARSVQAKVFFARRASALADACKPIPLRECNDPVAGTTLVATVCNDFVRWLPSAHALHMQRVILVGFWERAWACLWKG